VLAGLVRFRLRSAPDTREGRQPPGNSEKVTSSQAAPRVLGLDPRKTRALRGIDEKDAHPRAPIARETAWTRLVCVLLRRWLSVFISFPIGVGTEGALGRKEVSCNACDLYQNCSC
jgi:hypothetical protein